MIKHQEVVDQQTKQGIKRVDPMKDTTRIVTVAVHTVLATGTAQQSSKGR